MIFQKLDSFLKVLATLFISAYKLIFSDYMGWSCRFYPTCSSYAIACYIEHSFVKGTYLILKRLIRCRPFSSAYGFDPVPTSSKRRTCCLGK